MVQQLLPESKQNCFTIAGILESVVPMKMYPVPEMCLALVQST